MLNLDSVQVFVLAIVQGITEFLPISSSAHLIFIPQLFGWPDQGLAFDVSVHIGTLFAVLYYFRRDLWIMSSDFVAWTFRKKALTNEAKLLWALGFATIPAGIAGILFKSTIETTLRSPVVIAFTTIFFGLMLWAADKISQRNRNTDNMTWKDVLFIGCGQALALIPGTSRSGITLTTGLFRNLTRESAARFSFLLAVPVILSAGVYEGLHLLKNPTEINTSALLYGIIFSSLSGYLCIHLFFKLIQSVGVLPFVVYRLCLGIILLLIFVI